MKDLTKPFHCSVFCVAMFKKQIGIYSIFNKTKLYNGIIVLKHIKITKMCK